MYSASPQSGLRRDLRFSVFDGAAFSVMVGCGETYLPAFALAAGLGDSAAALTATVPMVSGALMQVISPAGIRRFGSLRRWTIFCAALQGLSFIPIALAAWRGSITLPVLLLLATFYWAGGLGSGPSWNLWMARLIPASIRARYFARRTRATQMAVLLGLIAAGFSLEYARQENAALLGFAWMFIVAAAARLISSFYLWKHRELPQSQATPSANIGRVWRSLSGRSGRMLIYMGSVQLATYVAAPFFTPYMLRHMAMSYHTYLMVLATAYVAKIVFLPTLGHFASRIGSRRLLAYAGLGIVPMSGLWIVSQSLPFVLLLQLIGGLAWAAYELATFLMLFEEIEHDERIGLLTIYNVINSSAIVAGTMIGWALLSRMGTAASTYYVLFAVSSGMRLAVYPLLYGIRRTDAVATAISLRTLSVRPSAGSLDAPILSAIPEQSD